MKHLPFLIVLLMVQSSLYGMNMPGNQLIEHAMDNIQRSTYREFIGTSANLNNQELEALLPMAKNIEAIRPSKKECALKSCAFFLTGGLVAGASYFEMSNIAFSNTLNVSCDNTCLQSGNFSIINIPAFATGITMTAGGVCTFIYGITKLINQWDM